MFEEQVDRERIVILNERVYPSTSEGHNAEPFLNIIEAYVEHRGISAVPEHIRIKHRDIKALLFHSDSTQEQKVVILDALMMMEIRGLLQLMYMFFTHDISETHFWQYTAFGNQFSLN